MIVRNNIWKEIHDSNGNKLTNAFYDISALQYSRNEITVILTSSAGVNRFYIIPVRNNCKCDIGISGHSVSCKTGRAIDLLQFLNQHKTWLNHIVRDIIFSGNIESC